jgi:hypothetical protein
MFDIIRCYSVRICTLVYSIVSTYLESLPVSMSLVMQYTGSSVTMRKSGREVSSLFRQRKFEFIDISPWHAHTKSCNQWIVSRRRQPSEIRRHVFSRYTVIMKAVRTSETSVYLNETARRYIPEGCHLHIRRRETLKHKTLVPIYVTQNCITRFTAAHYWCILRARLIQNTSSHTISLRFMLILSYYLSNYAQVSQVISPPSCFPCKILHAIFISTKRSVQSFV